MHHIRLISLRSVSATKQKRNRLKCTHVKNMCMHNKLIFDSWCQQKKHTCGHQSSILFFSTCGVPYPDWNSLTFRRIPITPSSGLLLYLKNGGSRCFWKLAISIRLPEVTFQKYVVWTSAPRAGYFVLDF